MAASVPIALRGGKEVTFYAGSSLPDTSDDLWQRVTMLYQGDPQLHALWAEATSTRLLTGDLLKDNTANATVTGALASRLLSPAEGARTVMIETGG